MLFVNPDPRIEVQYRGPDDREPRWTPVRFWLCQITQARDPLGQTGVNIDIVPIVLADGKLMPLLGATLREAPIT